MKFNNSKEVFDFIVDLREVVDEKVKTIADQLKPPCREGCHFCCNRPIPLFLSEWLLMRESLKHLKRDKKQRVLERAIRTQKKFDRFLAQNNIDLNNAVDIGKIEAAQPIECPFLFRSQCMIYDNRPIVCRIYGWPQQVMGDNYIMCLYVDDKLDKLAPELIIPSGLQFEALRDATAQLKQLTGMQAPAVNTLHNFLNELPIE
jgi:Fe-S-cluster containining protein